MGCFWCKDKKRRHALYFCFCCSGMLFLPLVAFGIWGNAGKPTVKHGLCFFFFYFPFLFSSLPVILKLSVERFRTKGQGKSVPKLQCRSSCSFGVESFSSGKTLSLMGKKHWRLKALSTTAGLFSWMNSANLGELSRCYNCVGIRRIDWENLFQLIL